MRKLLVIVLFLNSIIVAKSQNLTVEGIAPDLYITHTVAPKENFYSIGRSYNQAPKFIAAYNKVVMEKGLTIGQHIKIPLNDQNFDRGDNTKADEAIPLTHITTKGETLFKIAQDNNVTAQLIRKWNNLPSDHIAPGTPLVIGHLKMSDPSSAVSSAGNTSAAPASSDAPVNSKKSEAAQTKPALKDEKKDNPPVSVNGDSEQGKKDKESTPVQSMPNENGAQKASANTSEPAAEKDTALTVIPEKKVQTDTDNAVTEAPVQQEETPSTKNDESKRAGQPANESDGAFANLFDTQASQKSLNTKSGDAATFKSTSGWQDKKYYVLMSNVPPGTVLKISSSKNKVVYAKVLGSMPEMKENNGLLLRISNAAASYLGIIDPKFPVQVSYYQ